MTVFRDWKKFAIHQRRSETGCIPTGYEMILRSAGAKGIDFDTFQDDFDLDKGRSKGEKYLNHFKSVADEVHKKYPWVEFTYKSLATGHEKINFIDSKLANQIPVLISLATFILSDNSLECHIMPIVDAVDDTYILYEYVHQKQESIKKSELVKIHDRHPGYGCEVAFLKKLDEP